MNVVAGESSSSDAGQRSSFMNVVAGASSSSDANCENTYAKAHLHELMQWPVEHIETLSQSPRGLVLLLARLRDGVAMSTAYSGMAAPEMACRAMEAVLRETGSVPAEARGFRFTEACDLKESALVVLRDLHQRCLGPAGSTTPHTNRLPERLLICKAQRTKEEVFCHLYCLVTLVKTVLI